MKRGTSVKISFQSFKGLSFENPLQNSPKKEKIKSIANSNKKVEDKKGPKLSNFTRKNVNNVITKKMSQRIPLKEFSERKSIIEKQKSKDIISMLMGKKIDRKKFIERLKFVKFRLYVNYGYPYMKIKYKLKDRETHPIYYDYYQIDKILNNSKCKLVSKFHEYNLFFNDNEYLIRYSKRKDYYIAIKYLLFFVYGYDKITYSERIQNYYNLKDIKLMYTNLVSNKNIEQNHPNEDISRISNKKKTNINQNKLENYINMKFINELRTNPSVKKLKNYRRRFTVDFTFLNNRLNMLYHNNLKQQLNNKDTDKNKQEPEKINSNLYDVNDYYEGLGSKIINNIISCKCTKPKYLIISHIPFKLIPNCTPNLFPNFSLVYKILDKYLINIKKLKLDIYRENKDEKPVKKKRWSDYDETKYNEIIKEISFSSEDYYYQDNNFNEINRIHTHHNQNRRIMNDYDIRDVENIITSIEETTQFKKDINNNKIQKNIISTNDLKNDDKEYISYKKDSRNIISNSKFNKAPSSFISLKSNNVQSSNISSVNDKNKIDNESVNENKLKSKNDININTSNNIIIKNNIKLNSISKYLEDKDIKIDNKNLNKDIKNRENNKKRNILNKN